MMRRDAVNIYKRGEATKKPLLNMCASYVDPQSNDEMMLEKWKQMPRDEGEDGRNMTNHQKKNKKCREQVDGIASNLEDGRKERKEKKAAGGESHWIVIEGRRH
jgi:hypothetical protein